MALPEYGTEDEEIDARLVNCGPVPIFLAALVLMLVRAYAVDIPGFASTDAGVWL